MVDQQQSLKPLLHRTGALVWNLFKASCMVTGFTILVLLPSCRAMPLFYVDHLMPGPSAPAGEMKAITQITRGGFGTVWTTRILIEDTLTGDQRAIYKARDSDWQPLIRWTGRQSLVLTLPCDRVDFLSNPGNDSAGQQPLDRLVVRFDYPARCEDMKKTVLP